MGWLTGLLTANAVALCVAQYLSLRSLWLDEAFVAISVKERTLPGLFSELAYGQQFPRLYLSLIWLLRESCGYEIWTLRLLPMVFGIAAILLWSQVLLVEFSGPGEDSIRLCALLLFLTNPALYRLAAELKQYSMELFWSGYAVWYADRFLAPGLDRSLPRWILLCAGWLLPLLASFTYFLLLVPIAVIYFLPIPRRLDRAACARVALLALIAALALGSSYGIDLRYSLDAEYRGTWGFSFVSGSGPAAWVRSAIVGVSDVIGAWWLPRWWTTPATVLALLGLLSLVPRAGGRDRPRRLARAGAIVVAEFLLLSSLKRYPMIGTQRISLFFFPFAVAMMAEGLDFWSRARLAPVRIAGKALVTATLLLTLLWQLPVVTYRSYVNSEPEDLNPSLQKLDVTKSNVVVYDADSFVELRAAPHLPDDFLFLFIPSPRPQSPSSSKATRLRGGFYYLTTGDSADNFAKRLDAAYPGRFRYHGLTNHLFFFAPVP
jgi:hypothetical protein